MPGQRWSLRTWAGFLLAVIAMLMAAGYIVRLQFVQPENAAYRGKIVVGWESEFPYHYVQGEGELARRTGEAARQRYREVHGAARAARFTSYTELLAGLIAARQ